MLFALDEQQQQYFLNCGKNMTGQLQAEDAFYWKDMALKASSTCCSVRHGLIAVGALKQSTIRRSGRYQMDSVPGVHREIALQHYHKSIQSLRESTLNLQNEDSVRSLLISCMILAIFDDFIGHRGFALQHMRYARQLVLDSNFLSPTPNSCANEENVKLANMFLRLDVFALGALGLHHEYQTIPLLEQHSNIDLPDRFSSFDEARTLTTFLCWESWSFFYHSAMFHLLPRTQIPPQVLEIRDYLVNQLYDLCALLSKLKEEKPEVIRHPLSRIKALRLNPIIILVRLVSNFAPETACDALLDHFTYLVEFSREVLQYEQLENPDITGGSKSEPWVSLSGYTKPLSQSMASMDLSMAAVAETYSPEVRTVSPLLLVATKCRNPTLRREAINLLLASHRREWMQDSFLSGQIGRWMMELEQAGMDSNNYIPEHARVWGETVELDLQGRGAKVKCRQNFMDPVTGTLEWEWRETYFRW